MGASASTAMPKGKQARFVWKDIAQRTDLTALQQTRASEQALEIAVDQSSRLKALIESYLVEMRKREKETGIKAPEGSQLSRWADEIATFADEAFSNEVLVGVQGPTGAGKTALLNALIGMNDLLPSNNAEAATATVCKVSYNHFDGFHAKIHFRSYNDVRKELDTFFEALREHDRISTLQDEEFMGGEDDKENSLSELMAIIKNTGDKIEAVWDLMPQDLATMSTKDLLRSEDPVSKLLSRVISVYGVGIPDFAEKIKPYLDSTPIDVGKGEAARKMAHWPLISHVEIFVKSELLKSGLVLVGLPGLSDAVESRSAVAEGYKRKLALVVIVTPSVRAADERTGIKLMSRAQEVEMEMDGKLNSQSSCIVISKTDDINWQSFAKTSGQGDLLVQMRKLKNDIKDLEKKRKELRAIMNERAGTGLPTSVEDITGESSQRTLALEAYIDELKDLDSTIQVSTNDLLNLEGKVAHNAIKSRNSTLSSKITKQLRTCHEALTRKSPLAKARFNPPQVFPVSAKAFWTFVKEDLTYGEEIRGFPKVNYTGIPDLTRWMKENTAPWRKRHLLLLLHGYTGLLHQVQTWCAEECIKSEISRDTIVNEILDPFCEGLMQELAGHGANLKKKVKRCDPLGYKSEALAACGRQSSEIVGRWVYKYPQDKKQRARIHNSTFAAIINRSGGEFTSQGIDGPLKYNWMEDMALEFKGQIAVDWAAQLHKNIPQLEEEAVNAVGRSWRDSILLLRDQLNARFPNQDQYIAKQISNLLEIVDEVKAMVGAALVEISAQSGEMHANLEDELRLNWIPGFEGARTVAGGDGKMKRQHDVLLEYAEKQGYKTFRDSVMRVEQEFTKAVDTFSKKLDAAWARGLAQLHSQMDIVINNMVAVVKQDPYGDPKSRTIHLREGIRQICTEWTAEWNEINDSISGHEDTSIPSQWEPPSSINHDDVDADSGNLIDEDDELGNPMPLTGREYRNVEVEVKNEREE